MIDLTRLSNRALIDLLHEADAELHRRIAEGDALNERISDWFASLKRTNTALGRNINQIEREALRREGASGIG